MQINKQLNKWCLILLSVLILSACANNRQGPPPLDLPEETTVPIRMPKDPATLRIMIEHIERDLSEMGVRVINVGEDYLITIPSDSLFIGNSPRIQAASYAILNKVMLYLSCFDKVSVKVAAYTDDEQVDRRSHALTKAQARNVANYFWNGGVQARLLYAKGYGEAEPITLRQTPDGRRQNRRLEVIFRKVHVL